MTNIDTLRKEIDKLDKIIANTLLARLNIAKLIGTEKKKQHIAITDNTREKKVISHFIAIAGKDSEPVIRTIIELTKKSE